VVYAERHAVSVVVWNACQKPEQSCGFEVPAAVMHAYMSVENWEVQVGPTAESDAVQLAESKNRVDTFARLAAVATMSTLFFFARKMRKMGCTASMPSRKSFV
jgi:hypothetical protein